MGVTGIQPVRSARRTTKVSIGFCESGSYTIRRALEGTRTRDTAEYCGRPEMSSWRSAGRAGDGSVYLSLVLVRATGRPGVVSSSGAGEVTGMIPLLGVVARTIHNRRYVRRFPLFRAIPANYFGSDVRAVFLVEGFLIDRLRPGGKVLPDYSSASKPRSQTSQAAA